MAKIRIIHHIGFPVHWRGRLSVGDFRLGVLAMLWLALVSLAYTVPGVEMLTDELRKTLAASDQTIKAVIIVLIFLFLYLLLLLFALMLCWLVYESFIRLLGNRYIFDKRTNLLYNNRLEIAPLDQIVAVQYEHRSLDSGQVFYLGLRLKSGAFIEIADCDTMWIGGLLGSWSARAIARYLDAPLEYNGNT